MNKTIISAAVAASLLGSSALAAPFMAIGSSAELFVTAKAGIEFNDNVTLGNDYVAPGAVGGPSNPVRDDTVFLFAPGLSYEFGKNALVSGKLAYTENITRYSDNSDLDSELSDVTFTIQHKDEKSSTKGKASYRQLNQNTVDLRSPTLSRRDVFNAGVEHEMEMTAKSSILFGVDYTDTDYEQASFTDRTRTEIPLRYYYELTPKVDMSFGAQFRQTDTDTVTADAEDWFYSVGARGEFTPKLTGFLRLGVTDRNLKAGGDRTAFGLKSDFSYAYSEKTSLTFGLGNDFGTSGVGLSQENFDAFVGFNSKISPDFTLGSRLTYRKIDYFTRADDTYWQGTLSGDYIFNEYFQVRGEFNYKNNESGVVGGDFDNTVFSLSARLRY
ncbi:outer membrane beta-barrel protein [Actomonas aquatica]|uniref:Outer membrane beta-barrel protein n=1 Tax=Actomonas aquatica TaxID=2866162 RepID=A0ABZ1C6E4_9BACT|nr:outer membrane beta-barrel protein [Opitutus sp. WL0086]WRQ87169.1 outer membrane beta-barrel protein [Opitutus sp. WL0086]